MMELTKLNGYSPKGRAWTPSLDELLEPKLQVVSKKENAIGTIYGLVKGNYRSNENIVERYGVLFDIDKCNDPNVFEKLDQAFDEYKCFIHSTHSHDPKNNLYCCRVFMPTSEPIKPEDYDAVFVNFVNSNKTLMELRDKGFLDMSADQYGRFYFDWCCPPDRKDVAYCLTKNVPSAKLHKPNTTRIIQATNKPSKVDPLKNFQQGYKEGTRNNSLARDVADLFRLSNSFDQVQHQAQEINQLKCVPPLDTKEVNRIVDSISKQERFNQPKPVKKNNKKRYQLLSVSDIQKLPKIDWLVKDVLPAQGLACIYGPSGSSKSFLALDLSLSIACKTEWFGLKIKCVPVIYIVLEGLQGFIKRVNAWVLQNKIRPKRFFLIRDDINLFNFADVSDLVASLQESNFVNGLIVIDTLNQASPGVDENSVKEISQVLNHLKFIQRETNSLTLIVHHSGKDVNRGLRGSSSIRAALDTSIEVSSDSTSQKEWRIEKSKDAADGKTYKYSLKEITLGQDKDQSPITSCVVEPGAKTLYSKPKPTGKNQKIAYSKIQSLLILTPISGKCYQMPDTKMIEVEYAVEEISKVFTTTEQSKRRNQARTALQTLISNAFIHTGSEDGKDYLWIN